MTLIPDPAPTQPKAMQPLLNLDRYQQRAAATAEPRAYDLEYLVPGIVGEVGELFGQRAKAHWHGWSSAQLRNELVNEYGDICWMTALLLKTRGITDLDPAYPAAGGVRWGRMDPNHALLSASQNVHLQWLMEQEGIADSEKWMDESVSRLWRVLRAHCVDITGVPFQQVLNVNLAKLASRAARGVLRGSGDHR